MPDGSRRRSDRRASTSRRSLDERRSGSDRKNEGDPERRKGNRREEESRRVEEDRRSNEERRRGEDRRRERKKRIKIAIYGFLGGLLPAFILIFLNEFQGPPRLVLDGSSALEDKKPEQEHVRFEPKPDPDPESPLPLEPELPTTPEREQKSSAVQTLREDLLNLAPELYYGVKLESLISREDSTAIDSTVTVEAVEFLVKAQRWDTMASADKVSALNGTFGFLMEDFPNLTRTVRLVFDDGRPPLDLRFE
jgi:hypothetical protein